MHDGAGIAGRDRLALGLSAGGPPLPRTGPIVFLNAAPSAAIPELGAERFRCEQPFRPLHDRLAEGGVAVAPALETGARAPLAIVRLPRQRLEALGLVARALAAVEPGGLALIEGGKADGVDGLLRQVARAVPVAGSLPKAHGKLAWIAVPESLPEAVAGWAEACAPRPNADGFLTAPGMFSADGVDPGSARLAAQFDARLAGRVADLGAGWGWLAARALAGSPAIAALDLFEADARALAAARGNVPDPRARFHWQDVAALGRPAERYDWVLANPPFHGGRAADPDLGIAFIAAAARILKPGGRLLMVANRQLPYEAALALHFRSRATLAEDRAYKVIEASGPAR